MPNYHYKAINDFGKKKTGLMMVDDVEELVSALKRDGFEIISYKQKKTQSSFGLSNKVTQKDLISVFVHLHQLEKAGVSIVDSIVDLKDTADSIRVKLLMQEVYESIKNGSLFSESLAKRPDVFNPVYIGLLQSGEKTGTLMNSFESIIDDLKWSMDMKRKIRKATIGPMFGIIVMCCVMGAMTTIVVPKVTGFLIGQDITLPFSTLTLISFSNFVKNNWLYLLGFFPCLWIALKIIGRSEHIARTLDNLKLKIPLIGPILTKIDSAKFCQFFAMTFKSGLGVLECLEASSGVIRNKAIKFSIIEAKHSISDGQKLAKSIAATGYFPTLVSRMFKVGEDSGNMESALQNIKYFYDREINDSIDRLVGMIQPTITLVVGAMIGWIVIAVFGPVYGMFSKM